MATEALARKNALSIIIFFNSDSQSPTLLTDLSHSIIFTHSLSPTTILHFLLIDCLLYSSKSVGFMKVDICVSLFTDIHQVPRALS